MSAGESLQRGVATGGAGSWGTLVWVLVLGLVATLPIGAICGSLFPSPRSGGLIVLLFYGLSAISGIYCPITRFPHWLQDIAQVFPVYWLGLGMRSALLPDGMTVAEIGGSWRHAETAVVLGAWGGRGSDRGPDGAAADGPPRVRIDDGGSSCAGPATGGLT